MVGKAFTLIELIVGIIVLSMLILVAVPAYQGVIRSVKAASVRGTLGTIRSAIKAYQTNEKLEGRAESPPSLTYLQDRLQSGSCPAGHIFLNCDLPENPFSAPGNPPDTVTPCASGCSSHPTVGYGWGYEASSGRFWASTNTLGEKDW